MVSAIRRALTKGLAILLPALITIAIFAWAWGVLRDYAVVVIIDGIDLVQVFEAPDSLVASAEDQGSRIENVAAEPTTKNEARIVWLTPDGTLYSISRPSPLEEYRQVWLLPGERYSAFQLLGAYTNQQRSFDYSSGAVRQYATAEYIVAVLLAIVLVIVIGIFARGFFGKQFTALIDGLLKRIPVVNLVYPYAKQVVDFVFSEDKPIEFDAVVAVEWPREGCWQIGFVTGSGLKTMTDQVGTGHTTVFVPMSPIPMTGFTVFVPRDQVMEIDITVEEACMVILSGGVLTPPDQQSKVKSERAERWNKAISQARVERARNTGTFDRISMPITSGDLQGENTPSEEESREKADG